MTKRLNGVLLAMLCIAAAACSGDTETMVAPSEEGSALDLVTIEQLKAHYEFLADDARQGRMTGEPGYDESADYVAAQFESIGLEPGGEEGGWFQQVPLVSYRVDTESTQVITHRDGIDSTLKYRDDYGMNGDKVREEDTIRAEVVYVGFGVHAPELGYSDYDGVDVDGKIVAMFGGAPAIFHHNERAYYASSRTKATEAVARGAVGAISLRSRKAQRNMPWERFKKLTGTRPGMAWINLTGEANDYFPELRGSITISAVTATELMAGTPISFEEALDAIDDSRASSTPLGFEVTMARRTNHQNITSPNVIGIVRGTDPELRNEFVVYSAHLDHLGVGVEENGDSIYNGAYDNSMGIALMIETARAIAASPPRRSVLFVAVTAEERGLLGSDYFAHYPTVPSDSIVANVNLDMPLFLSPVADLVAFGAEHSSLQAPTDSAAQAEGFTLSPDPFPEENIFIRSDQYSFVRKGVPSIYLIPGFGSLDPEVDGEALFRHHLLNYYHRPSDDLSRPVHWESARRFARANARIGLNVADADERPTWNEGDFFGERFGSSRGAGGG
ncbi:MAG: M28 family metallopeptidase [Woeseiaceae bacterium]|nr:M28 family metallopeptidase [Woeseiaceae bacterium]